MTVLLLCGLYPQVITYTMQAGGSLGGYGPNIDTLTKIDITVDRITFRPAGDDVVVDLFNGEST